MSVLNNYKESSKMTEPTISVIIPTHKRSVYLERALKSINSQKHRDKIEIILISDEVDWETDKVATKELIKSDVYVRRNGVRGPAESRNLGLHLASGDFIMFLDDDDSWHCEFSDAFFAINSHVVVNFIYTDCVVVKESRGINGPVNLGQVLLNNRNIINNDIFVKNQIHMSCCIFDRRVLTGMKFDNKLLAYEDWDFLLGILEKTTPIHVPILSSCVYEVDDSTTDRRGSSSNASNFNAVIDYLKIYTNHKIDSEEIKSKRHNLLKVAGLSIDPVYL